MDEQRDAPDRDRPEEHTTSPVQEDRAKPPFRVSDDEVGARTGNEDERDETG